MGSILKRLFSGVTRGRVHAMVLFACLIRVTVVVNSTAYSLFENSQINKMEKMHNEWLQRGGFYHFNETMNVCGGVIGKPWWETKAKCMRENLHLLCPKRLTGEINNFKALFPDICEGHVEQLGNYRGCKISEMIEQVKGKDGCVVISVGSRGDFQFEEAIYNKTSCTIHTFDGGWFGHLMPEYIQNRTIYHRYHFGKASMKIMGGRTSMTDFAGALRLANVTTDRPLVIMKVDCEGCEKTIFSHIIQNTTLEHELPYQIYTEVHWSQIQPTLTQNSHFMHTAKNLLTDSNFVIFENVRGYKAEACEVAFVRLQDKHVERLLTS